MSVQISIVHYAEEKELKFNDVLVSLVRSIRELTKYRPYRLNIIDNQMHPKARKDIETKIPDVDILRTSGKHHTFPAGANLAIESMKGRYLAMFHTDLLVSWGWLGALVQNLKESEKMYGVPCATSPLLLPYPRLARTLKERVDGSRIPDGEYVERYMRTHGVPYKAWRGVPVAVSRPGLVTDNGHQLGGAYVASKNLFDEVGSYDPVLNRMNDKSYGIRTLMTRCRNTTSNKAYLHHIGGLQKGTGCYVRGGYENSELGLDTQFILKWGKKIYRKVEDGSIWGKLHKAQREGTAKQMIERYRG